MVISNGIQYTVVSAVIDMLLRRSTFDDIDATSFDFKSFPKSF